MKIFAIYTMIAMAAFSIYSIYYAVAGDNAPFWTTIVIACLPVMAFALLYLFKNR